MRFSLSDIVGTWVCSAENKENHIDLLTITEFKNGKVTGNGINSVWEINESGKITGKIKSICFSNSHNICINSDRRADFEIHNFDARICFFIVSQVSYSASFGALCNCYTPNREL